VTVIRLADVRDTPLSVDEVHDAVADASAGGIALFTGAVRNHDHGRDVRHLSYSAHPSATAELRRVCEKVAAEFGVTAIAAVHRVGDLAVGDLAVVVAVSWPAPGRGLHGLPRPDRRAQAERPGVEASGIR